MKKLSAILFMVPAISLAHNVPDNIKIVPLKNMGFPVKIKKEMQSYNDIQKQNGYVQSDNTYTRKLLLMRSNTMRFLKSDDPAEQELKKSLSEIPLNFKYKNNVPNTIAYTALGLETKEGWSGIKIFFDGKEIGTCELSVFNIANANQPMQLNEDGLTYDVNDKPTRINIEGSHNSGFMYSVRWYDKNFVHELQCANLTYDKRITEKIIVLANTIDKG